MEQGMEPDIEPVRRRFFSRCTYPAVSCTAAAVPTHVLKCNYVLA